MFSILASRVFQCILKEAIQIGGASAVTAGSLFVYKGKHNAVLINYPSITEIQEIIIY